MHKDIKAILFDFDGTLINSVDVYYDVLLELGNKYGNRVTREDFFRINGMSNGEAIKLLLRERKIRKRALLYLAFYVRKYKRRLTQETRTHPHAQECLLRLAPMYRMAIVTSGKRSHVDYFSRKFNFEPFIEEIVTRETVENKKPDPEPYLRAAKALQVAPKNCLIIEDSPNGVLSGKRAGMRTCAVLHTTPRSYFVGDYAPDKFIEDLGKLTEDWLKQIGG